jgi:inhibitor of KinA sporulation pathway (predicted exonuclease)
MRDQNYLALDLEYNSDGKTGTQDIIQVGLCVGSPVSGIHYKEQFFVKPSNKEVVLYPFITKLTGITQENYDANSISWSTVVDEIRRLNENYKFFVNPVTWGIGDSYDLIKTVKEENLDFPFFGRRIIDVKHLFLFIECANGRAMSGGLSSAMGKHKLQFQGKSHRADNDAYNTLIFYFHLLKRQKLLEDTIKSFKALP